MWCTRNNNVENLSLFEQKLIQSNIEFDWKLKVGYCPTMQKYIDKIINKDNFELIAFWSTAEALENLKNNNIWIALIWRIAKSYEIDKNTKFKKLLDNERFTYISNKKIWILENEISKYQDKIKLISWNDWQDNMELAIILDSNWNKVEKFRLPILYFK